MDIVDSLTPGAPKEGLIAAENYVPLGLGAPTTILKVLLVAGSRIQGLGICGMEEWQQSQEEPSQPAFPPSVSGGGKAEENFAADSAYYTIASMFFSIILI